MLFVLGLVPRPVVAFSFSVGTFVEVCLLDEALGAAIEAVVMPVVRWQDASTTGVEALAAANEELLAGGGTDDFAAADAVGAEDLEAEGFVTETFDAEGFGAEGFGF